MRHAASGDSCGTESTGSVTTPSVGGMYTQTPRQELKVTAQRTIAASLWHAHTSGPRASVTHPSPDGCHSCQTHGPRCRIRDTCKAPKQEWLSRARRNVFSPREQTHPQRADGEWLGKQPAYHAPHVEQRVEEEEDTWVSTWTDGKLVEKHGLASLGKPWSAMAGGSWSAMRTAQEKTCGENTSPRAVHTCHTRIVFSCGRGSRTLGLF